MTIAESAGRLGSTLLAMIRTRLELAAVEMEEESLRLLSYLLMALLALFLAGIAIVLFAFFVILLFWDSYRTQAVFAMAALFGLAGAAIGFKVRANFARKPALLEATLAELTKDIDSVTGHYHGH